MLEIKPFITISMAIVLFNMASLYIDKDFLSDFKEIKNKKEELIELININDVYSNSFFFFSKKDLTLKKKYIYKIENVSSEEIIYFNVNTIKLKDTLYFFQHIDWITKKRRKIQKGKYRLYKLIDEH